MGKLLGPKSQRKKVNRAESDSEEEAAEEDKPQDEGKNIHSASNINQSFFLKKNRSRIGVRLVSLFRHELCKSVCSHCQETGRYSLQQIQLDLPGHRISFEC